LYFQIGFFALGLSAGGLFGLVGFKVWIDWRWRWKGLFTVLIGLALDSLTLSIVASSWRFLLGG